MKKFVAMLLAVVLCMTFALAEIRAYVMVGVSDAEGNYVTIEETEMPVLAFALDDETMECGFGDEENLVKGTAVIESRDDENGIVILVVTLEDGTEMHIIYEGESDTMSFTDEEGYVYIMMNVDELVEAEAA